LDASLLLPLVCTRRKKGEIVFSKSLQTAAVHDKNQESIKVRERIPHHTVVDPDLELRLEGSFVLLALMAFKGLTRRCFLVTFAGVSNGPKQIKSASKI